MAAPVESPRFPDDRTHPQRSSETGALDEILRAQASLLLESIPADTPHQWTEELLAETLKFSLPLHQEVEAETVYAQMMRHTDAKSRVGGVDLMFYVFGPLVLRNQMDPLSTLYTLRFEKSELGKKADRTDIWARFHFPFYEKDGALNWNQVSQWSNGFEDLETFKPAIKVISSGEISPLPPLVSA